MSAADTGRAKSIFIDAIENYQPDQWPTFLDEACGGDCQLRTRVDDLLNAHKNLDSIPKATGSSTEDFETPDVRIGVEIGPYKLLQVIGEGGFGVVYMAEQLQPVNRRVAIKIIKPGMDSREVIARFEAERQALAMMDHPNISRVLDRGCDRVGEPYFVMELVQGRFYHNLLRSEPRCPSQPIRALCNRVPRRCSMLTRRALFIVISSPVIS